MDPAILQEEEFQGSLNLPLWRRIFRYTLPHKRFLIPMILAGLATSGCEVLLTLIGGMAINEAVTRGREAVLWPYGLAYAALCLMTATCTCLFIFLGGRVSTAVSHDMRRDSFAKLQSLSFAYYDQRPVGWLLARLTSDCDRLSRLLGWGVLDMTWGFSFLLVVAVAMLAINWQLALAVFVVLPPLAWVTREFQKRLLLTSRTARRINSIITGSYNEALMGVRTTKTLVREAQNLAEFKDLTGQLFVASFRNAVLGSTFWPLVMVLGTVATGMALWVGGGFVVAGTIEVGTLLAFMWLAGRFFEPVHELSRVFTDVLGAQAAAERVQGLLDTVPDVKDSPEVEAVVGARQAALASGAARAGDGLALDGLPDRVGEIELRDVSFAYKEGRQILSHFNLTIRVGETLALVGPTGGGKTTLVSLLCRFYEPTGGQILFDGVDYRRRSLLWLQGKLGIVLQSPHLFAGTVRENIAYGNLAASPEQVEQAARLAQAHAFVMAMDAGYESQVGPGGNRLSTGQKQLIALARAILADPRIFVMDEATSSVDTETERLIQRGVEAVLKGRTSLVIAHRLSTIRSADRILVIEKGRIAEQGNHLDLLRQKGKYYRLYTSQFAREREDDLLRGPTEPKPA
jgi:ATP-binding cassette, subfamily B, bacterial